MEDYDSAIEKIRTEVKGDLSEVWKKFLDNFGEETECFANLMTNAFLRWSELDGLAGQD